MRSMRRRAMGPLATAVAAVVASLVTGCSLHAHGKIACEVGQACESGYTCRSGTCVADGPDGPDTAPIGPSVDSEADAPMPSEVDAPPEPDAPVELPADAPIDARPGAGAPDAAPPDAV